ncbi:MAG: sensor domain-containing diguanylate cyclase [Bacillota bacterium]
MAWLFHRKLKTILSLLFLLASLLPVSAAMLCYYAFTSKALLDSNRNSLQSVVLKQGEFINYWIEEREQYIRNLAAEEVLHSLDEMALQTFLERKFPQSLDFSALVMANTEGKTVAASSGPEGIFVGDRDYFLSAVQGRPGQSFISEVLLSRISGRPALIVASPVVSGGQAIGVIFGVVSMGRISRLLSMLDLGQTGEAFLVNNQGFFLTEAKYTQELNQKGLIQGSSVLSLKTALDIEGIWQSQRGTVQYKDYRGQPVLAAYYVMPEMKWALIAKKDVAEILAGAGSHALGLGLLIGLGAALLFLPFFMGMAKGLIEEPLASLAGAARRIAEGELGLTVENSAPASEINSLLQSFNAMSTRLKEYHSRLLGQVDLIETQKAELSYQNEELLRAQTRLLELNRQLEELATTDSLTGLYNRRYAMARLHSEATRALRYGYPVSVIMIDVDLFKQINDRMGHQSGDRVLAEIGSLLSNGVRYSDVVCRFGGEEFLVILAMTGLKEAAQLAERLRERIQNYSFLEDNCHVTISQGIASLETGSEGLPLDLLIEDLLNRADNNLYKAKEKRNHITW